MNLPSSNIRGFFEILMPGIFLVINAVLAAYFTTAVLSPELLPIINSTVAFIANPVAVVLLLVVFGYPAGVVLRLLKTSGIDALSAKYIRKIRPKLREEVYLKEGFFYNKWMLEKSLHRLPAEAAIFYKEYWADKDTGNPTANTSFFNLCKMIVAKNDPQSGNEIYASEALIRFLSGSYFALLASAFLMFVITWITFIKFSPQTALLPALITILYLILLHVILSEYRFLRCKEVDTVFFACFANREHFEKLIPNRENRFLFINSQNTEYAIRKNLISRAWEERRVEGRLVQSLDLEELISLMKTESRIYPYLSSMYFAGSEIDHPYFLENTKFAVGLAVLPEDAKKAGSPKQHPHQTEIILVLKGTICLHFEENHKMTNLSLNQGEHFVITEGICHWVTSINNDDAVFLFIKTNPSEEPRSEPCSKE